MLYEIAEAIGQYVCDCLTVELGDPDEDVLNEGFACYCDTSECCYVVGWADMLPDMCCGTRVTMRMTDFTDGIPTPCFGPREVEYDIEYIVCQPALDTNNIDVFNDFAKFMSAIMERLNACFQCQVEFLGKKVINVTAMSPTNDGVTFAIRVQHQ